MTPMEIDEDVMRLLEKVNPTHDPIFIEIKPEAGANISDCFPVVENKVKTAGGRMILGWQVWKTKNLIEAEAHAVWETPDEKLIDITPKDFPATHILFFEDRHLKYEGRQINNIRLNITKNALVDDFIAISEEIFAFENRGARAKVHYLDPLLNTQQYNHLTYMKETKAMIGYMLGIGCTRDSLCGCGSGRKYKNCHGENLLKKLRKIK